MHTLQVHVPGVFVGALAPAAAQLKPTEGATGGSLGGSSPAVDVPTEFGRGSSQEAHLDLVASLSTMQTLHVHVPGAFVGALRPAPAQLKPTVGAAGGLGGSDTASGPAVFDVDSGRGSSQQTHLTLAASLSTIQAPHFHDPAAFTGGFIDAASQLKPVDAGFAPRVNANVGSEDESEIKATSRSLAWFTVTWELVSTLKENDGRDTGSRESAACFGSLGADFVECDSVLGPASGGGLGTARLGAGVGRLGMTACFGAGGDVDGSWGCSVAGAGVSKAVAGGGESGSLSAANPKRSLDGSFGADDLSGKEDLAVAPNKLPFDIGVFLALG